MKGIVLGLFFVSFSVAQASTDFHAGFGLAYGGDELAEITFVDNSTEELRAGSGFEITVGVVHKFNDSPFSMQFGIGYLSDETSARNSRARFSRYPVTALAFWRQGAHRVGGGFTRHFSPTLDLDNLGGRLELDGATGYILEYGYRYFSVRYMNLDYQVGGIGVDGSGLGLFVQTGFE